MDMSQLKEMLGQEPFHPFRIKLADGSGYDIRNPDLVVPMQTQALVAFPAEDRYAVVSLFQIVALERLPTRGGGGKGRGRRKSA